MIEESMSVTRQFMIIETDDKDHRLHRRADIYLVNGYFDRCDFKLNKAIKWDAADWEFMGYVSTRIKQLIEGECYPEDKEKEK